MNDRKVMLITGTRTGIGRYLAEYYVNKGFEVIGCSRAPSGYKLASYRHFCLDICDEAGVKMMFDEISKAYGRLDVLINNAGVAVMNYVLLTPLKTVQDTFNTNFVGAFLFSREAAKLMQKNKFGRIINISSVAVGLSQAGTAIYSASKAALEQFSKVFAKEAAPYGVTVNNLSLSFVKDSPMASAAGKKVVEDTLKQTSSKSLVTFEDISRAIDSLISESSDLVTGETRQIS